MKLLAFALTALFALGVAQGYPLQGGNGATNCTIFGFIKGPLDNSSQDSVLKVDVGITTPDNVTYQVMDDKDILYTADSTLSEQLQPGRSIQAFVIPKAVRVFKLFKAVPASGAPITINWWKTPKESNGDLVIRYYGVVDYDLSAERESYIYEIGLGNNGTKSIPVSPENFTLLDQNGWDYYTEYGFSPMVIEADKAIRVRLSFTDLSPLSIPRALVFDAFGSSPIAIDFRKDYGQLTEEMVGSSHNATQVALAPVAQITSQEAATLQMAPAPAETLAPTGEGIKAASQTISLENPALAKKNEIADLPKGSRGTDSVAPAGVASSTSSTSPAAESMADRLAKVKAKLKGK
jgi:hypothetical protein